MANLDQTFEQFLVNQSTNISLNFVIMSLVLSAVLGFILGRLYISYGTALSNRRNFAKNFVLLSVTTTLIIITVKSSLALSLGLVGALSIIRFRTPIKDPEELVFLFICISVGLGFGANQFLITIIAFMFISLLIYARSFMRKKEENQNLYLTVSGKDIELKDITNILKKHCPSIKLKRFDKTEKGVLEAAFFIDIDNFEDLEKMKKELGNLSKGINIAYLDRQGL